MEREENYMKYVNQLTDEELKEIYSLFLCDGGKVVSLEITRCEDCIDLDGYVKEPDSDNQFDTEDGFIEVEDNYSLTDYFVKTYCHSGGSYCQKKFREYMYKKFKTKYAKDFLLG